MPIMQEHSSAVYMDVSYTDYAGAFIGDVQDVLYTDFAESLNR